MELIFNEILKAVGYLFIAGIVYQAWDLAYKKTLEGNFKNVLIQGFIYCSIVALFAGASLGNPTCISFDQDNRGGTCYEYTNDGYEATIEQKIATFAYYITLLYIPVMLGVHRGKKKKTNTK